MNRTRTNLWIDLTAFVAFLFLATTGILMHFVLPPGSHSAKLLGLGRHAWGAVHFWVAAGLAVVVAVHLCLHWRWIVSTLGRRSKAK